MTERPEFCNEDHLLFLDNLREEGSVNMFGSAPVLAQAFEISTSKAIKIVSYWMQTFSERRENLK